MLYNIIENPINVNTIDEVLNRFCSDGSFYNALVGHGRDKNKIIGQYNTYYNDQLMVLLFNAWKSNIIDYCQNIERVNPEYRNKILAIGRFIINKNPKTAADVLTIINYYYDNNKELSQAMESFKWTNVGEFSSWNHIDSSAVLLGRHTRSKIEHRLYINCDSTYTHQIAYELVKRCHERRQKYYFKFDDFGNRDDTLVIYCNSNNISTFIEILNDIKRDLKLDEQLHNPPLLTGKIDGWIGYGSEPADGKKHSFNTKREEHLKKCIREETADWIGRNKEHEFNINGKRTKYKDYIVEKMLLSKKKSFVKYIDNEEQFYNIYRFKMKRLKEANFNNYIREYLKKNFDYIIRCLKNDDRDFKIEFKVDDGKVVFSRSDLEGLLKAQTIFIRKVSSKYKYDLIDRIRRTSSETDIDPNNYSFDLSKKELLIASSKKQNTYTKK